MSDRSSVGPELGGSPRRGGSGGRERGRKQTPGYSCFFTAVRNGKRKDEKTGVRCKRAEFVVGAERIGSGEKDTR